MKMSSSVILVASVVTSIILFATVIILFKQMSLSTHITLRHIHSFIMNAESYYRNLEHLLEKGWLPLEDPLSDEDVKQMYQTYIQQPGSPFFPSKIWPRQALRQRLFDLQFPPTCSQQRFVIIDGEGGGLGAELSHIQAGMALAFATNRTFVLKNLGFYSNSYYLRSTNCTVDQEFKNSNDFFIRAVTNDWTLNYNSNVRFVRYPWNEPVTDIRPNKNYIGMDDLPGVTFPGNLIKNLLST